MKKNAFVAILFLLFILVACATSKINNEINENFKAEHDTNVKMHSKNSGNDSTEVSSIKIKKPTGNLLEVPREVDENRPLDFSPAPPEPGMRFVKDNFSTLNDEPEPSRTAAELLLDNLPTSKTQSDEDKGNKILTIQPFKQSDVQPSKPDIQEETNTSKEPVKTQNNSNQTDLQSVKDDLLKKTNTTQTPRNIKNVIKYLFIPATGVDYNSELLADTILKYTSLFDIDLLVVSGEYRQLMTVVANLGVDFNMHWHASHIVSLCGQGVVFSKQNQKSTSGDPVVEFEDYTVLLYNLCSSQINENEMFIGKEKNEGRKKFSSIVTGYVSSSKPVLAFTSPEEVSQSDLQYTNVNIEGAGTLLSFDNELNGCGFVDLFDSVRFTAPSIGLQNPGYTYQSAKQKARIDFVYGRSVIPCESSVQMLPVLYEKNGVSRYAILGSVAI